MVIYLERGADLHMFQLMPLPLTVSCFSKIQIGFSFLVTAHLGSPGERAVKRVCVVVSLSQICCDSGILFTGSCVKWRFAWIDNNAMLEMSTAHIFHCCLAAVA